MACQAQYTPDTTKKGQIFSNKDNSANYFQVTNTEQLENIKKFRAALDEQDYEAITELTTVLGSSEKNHDQVFRIFSDLLLSQKMFDLAVSTLKKIEKHNKDDYQAIAHTCAQIFNHQCAAEALFDYIHSSESEQLSLTSTMTNRLWNHLLASTEGTFNLRPDSYRELIPFAKAFVKSDSMEKKRELWLEWKNSNSGHSFALKPPLALQLVENFRKPNIAVILPLSGDFQAAGKAVRDGIITSSFGESKRLRGALNFYDSEAQSMSSILKTITQGDATHVIGPLLKENCRVFTQISNELSKPILLLNYLSEDIEKSKYQYSLGLSIEHEIDSLLEEINHQALNNILIVSNASSWAVRSNNLFEDQWLKTVTNAKFENPRDITGSISNAVGVESSNSRKESIEKITRKPLEFLPRTRKDIDAIVAFVSPSESESLEPILKFHFLEDTPLFASSQSELHNYKFSELKVRSLEFPFIGQRNTSNAFLKNQFELRTRFDQELFALGMDAYKLLQLIEIFRVSPGLPVSGQTGLVQLDEKQNFFRRLKLIENQS